MKRSLFYLSLAICAATSTGQSSYYGALAQSRPVLSSSQSLIVPGVGIGEMLLGDSHSKMVAILGNPTEVRQRSAGIEEAEWDFTPKNADYAVEDFKRDSVYVIYASGKAIQIGVTSPKYRVAGGFTTRNTLAQVFAKFKGLEQTAFSIESPGGGGYAAYFYDDIPSGIAFMVGAQDYFDHSVTPDYIYVHRSGKAIMPEMGATATQSELNNPMQPIPAVAEPQMNAAEKREKLLTATYVRDAAGIFTDSLPMLQNVLTYARRERDGDRLPRSVWRQTLNNLDSNAKRYKTIKFVPTTAKKAHSYSLAYASNTAKYVSYMKSWVDTGDESYLFAAEPSLNASNHYLELMTVEYKRIIDKVN